MSTTYPVEKVLLYPIFLRVFILKVLNTSVCSFFVRPYTMVNITFPYNCTLHRFHSCFLSFSLCTPSHGSFLLRKHYPFWPSSPASYNLLTTFSFLSPKHVFQFHLTHGWLFLWEATLTECLYFKSNFYRYKIFSTHESIVNIIPWLVFISLYSL